MSPDTRNQTRGERRESRVGALAPVGGRAEPGLVDVDGGDHRAGVGHALGGEPPPCRFRLP
ncbi:MAG: hypothetical protein GY772_20915 [bacterium]|nr:hypothetical protein [bacterium]